MAKSDDASLGLPPAAQAQEDAFYALRGRAIQAYANVERALYRLFLHWTGVDEATGSATFYGKLMNTQVRDAVLHTLRLGHHKHDHEPFWDSAQKLLQDLTEQRNNIVHWYATVVGTPSGEASLELVPVRESNPDPRVPGIKADDLREFTQKCLFLAEALTRFWNLVGKLGPSAQVKKQWLPSFEQPLTYPPLSDSIFLPPAGALHRQLLIRPYEVSAQQSRKERTDQKRALSAKKPKRE